MLTTVVTEQSIWRKIRVLVSRYGTRHTQCIMLFLLFVLTHATKVILSVAIVAMTDPTSNSNTNIPTYSWDDKSVILSSLLWGNIVTQIPSAKLNTIYGSKKVLVITMFINSIFCCLIPPMASVGSWGVIICRVCQGLSMGFFYPSAHSLLGRWVPLEERSRLGSFVYTGGPLGSVISLIVTGAISGSSLGWPYAFYLFGALCLCWSVLYFAIGSNSPADHTRVDPVERAYIETSLQHTGGKTLPPTPWKKIFRSIPVWAIIVSHCGQNWSFYILLTSIPRYINGVLDFNIQQNGLLSAGPYFALWVMGFVLSKMADTLIKNQTFSVGVVRKILNSIGSFVPGAALLALGIVGSFYDNLTVLTIVLFFIAVAADSAVYCGFFVNHLDLSPVHAGTLMAVTTAISNIFAIAGPLALQWIVTDETNSLQWATAFYIASAFYILTNTFYLIFGSGEVQVWNSLEERNDPEKS